MSADPSHQQAPAKHLPHSSHAGFAASAAAASSSTAMTGASSPARMSRIDKRKRKRESLQGIKAERQESHDGSTRRGSAVLVEGPVAGPSKKARTASAGSAGSSRKGNREGRKKQNKSSRSGSGVGVELPILPSSTSAAGLVTIDPNTDASTPTDLPPVSADDQKPSLEVESKDAILARLTARASASPVKPGTPLSGAGAGTGAKPKHFSKQLTTLKDGKIAKLQQQLKAAQTEAEMEKAAWEREREGLKGRAEELAKQLEEQAEKAKADVEANEAKDLVIQNNVLTMEKLRDAATCGVCLDTFKDPHILSCGHIACKDCLTSWFRTPVAFMHEIPNIGDVVPADRDVSYRTKVCHVCRTAILRRPSRMYHFDAILEPLGINPHLPTESQEAADGTDPWYCLFPVERESYRIFDQDDGVPRCPECLGEVDDNVCASCDIEFSEDEDDGYDEAALISEGSEAEQGSEDSDDGGEDTEAEEEVDGDLHFAGRANGTASSDDNDDGLAARFGLTADLAAANRVDRRIANAERELRRRRDRALFDLEAGVDDDDGEDEDDDDGDIFREAREERGRRVQRWHSGSSSGTDTGSGSDSEYDLALAPPAPAPAAMGGFAANLMRTMNAARAGGERVAAPRRADRANAQPHHNGRDRPRNILADSEDDEGDDDDLALEADEGYESSFINDDEDEDEDEDAGEEEGEGGEGEGAENSDKEEYDPVAVRQRRLERFGQPAQVQVPVQQRSVSPVIRSSASSGRKRARAVIDPDSD